MCEYYNERLTEQYSICSPEFGVLTVRVYFRYMHGLINYTDTKAKCRHKNGPVKGLCGRCLSV
jgi:hypothetical protein